MKILNLKNALEYFDIIAEYHQKEWAHLNDGETLDGRKERMKSYITNDFIPSMYIGLINNNIIGTAAIIKCDLSSRPDLSPWLASVYVFPEYRGKGYSKKLVKHVMKTAKANGINKLYLYTEDAVYLYSRLGWKIIGTDKCLENNVTLMETKL